MQINSINTYNKTNKSNPTFGYEIPFDRSIIEKYAKRAMNEHGQKGYHEYLDAIKHFTDKRFDASPIINKCLPVVKAYGDWANEEFIELCEYYGFPKKVLGYKTKTVTKTVPTTVTKQVPKKQSFLDKLFGREQKYKEVNETVDKEVKETVKEEITEFDFKNYNPKIYTERFYPNGQDEDAERRMYVLFNEDSRDRALIHEQFYNSEFPFRDAATVREMEAKIDKAIENDITDSFETLEINIKNEAEQQQKRLEDTLMTSKVKADFDALQLY